VWVTVFFMHINVSPDYIGSPSWIVVDSTTGTMTSKKSMEVDETVNTWILSPTTTSGEHDFLQFARMCGRQLTFPRQQYVQLMDQLNVESSSMITPPWWKIMPRQAYRDDLHELARDVVGLCEPTDMDYYLNVFEPTRAIVGDLVGCHIDGDTYHTFVAEAGTDTSTAVLSTFSHDEGGMCHPTRYDVVGSRTGRMTVLDGPNILTLKKEYRKMITSRWCGGRVVMLDYSSLEARVLAYEAGLNLPEDIYRHISDEILGGVSRDVAKISVISTLYGGGVSRLTQYVDADTAHHMVDSVRRLFKVDELTLRLREQLKQLGFIRNFYGRRIQTPTSDHVLVNSYAQSTGVDVAMLGFKVVCDRLKHMKSLPMFVLADALIIDIHPDEVDTIDELCEVCSQIRGYEHKFFVKPSSILT